MDRRLQWLVLGVVLVAAYGTYATLWLSISEETTSSDDLAEMPFVDGTEIGFTNATASAGVKYHQRGQYSGGNEMIGDAGVYVLDFNRDGWRDLLLVGGAGPALYENARGTFERVPQGLPIDGPVRAAHVVDYDRDGWQDVVLLRMDAAPIVIHNDGGEFTRADLTMGGPLNNPTGATSGDVDGDGCPDLYIIQNGDWLNTSPAGMGGNYTASLEESNGQPNRFYRGTCDGFENATGAMGGVGHHWSLATSIVDLTGDGVPDIHVANDWNNDVLHVNQGNGTFEKRVLSPVTSRNGMSSEVGDVDRDGRQDVFVTNIYAREFAQGTLTLTGEQGNNLLLNRDRGQFEYAAGRYGIARGGWGWAATFVDLDNDGDRDLLHTTRNDISKTEFDVGYPVLSYPAIWERRGERFVRVNASGVGFENTNGRGIAHLDYDRDGDVDLVLASQTPAADVVLGNGSPEAPVRVYENTAGGRALQVSLKQTEERPALGASVSVTMGNRTRHAVRNSKADFLSQDTRVLHFGAGDARRAAVRIRWRDGRTHTFDGVPTEHRLVVAANGSYRTIPFD
jgi:hypothetical protein